MLSFDFLLSPRNTNGLRIWEWSQFLARMVYGSGLYPRPLVRDPWWMNLSKCTYLWISMTNYGDSIKLKCWINEKFSCFCHRFVCIFRSDSQSPFCRISPSVFEFTTHARMHQSPPLTLRAKDRFMKSSATTLIYGIHLYFTSEYKIKR